MLLPHSATHALTAVSISLAPAEAMTETSSRSSPFASCVPLPVEETCPQMTLRAFRSPPPSQPSAPLAGKWLNRQPGCDPRDDATVYIAHIGEPRVDQHLSSQGRPRACAAANEDGLVVLKAFALDVEEELGWPDDLRVAIVWERNIH